MTLPFKEKKVSSTRLKSYLDSSCHSMIYKGDHFFNYLFYKLVKRLQEPCLTNIYTYLNCSINHIICAKKYSDLIFIDIFSNDDVQNINKFIGNCGLVSL